MRFQIRGLDNVKQSEHARFCIESINVPILYDVNDDRKSIAQTIVRTSNLSSINCFDTHGNGQTDPVIYTAQTQPYQQRIGTAANNVIYQNLESSPVFIIHTQRYYIIFLYQAIFLNNRYFDFTLIMQFLSGDFIDLTTDQRYFDLIHISFIVYDLDEEEHCI